MRILAIETSCDETAICLLEATETPTGVEFCVINNITHTQLEHVEFGGVFPAIAKREHQINLPIILDQIIASVPPLRRGGVAMASSDGGVDYICVTNGPGLEPALWCGIVFAKELGEKWSASRRIPIVPVNHMEGHILSVLVPNIENNFAFNNDIQFPALALLISGGHTELVLVNNIGDYKIIGKTRDDAVGEAFDKVGRMLNLPYPGGPEISKLADQFSGEKKLELPRPMIHTKDYDFSFSGLKTAVLYHIQELKTKGSPSYQEGVAEGRGSFGENISDQDKQEIAHEFQHAVADVLIKKTNKAIEEFGIQTLIIGGGVAASKFIIESFQENLSKNFPDVKLLAPTKGLTGDNALMIALAGYFKIQKNPDADYGDIKAIGNLGL